MKTLIVNADDFGYTRGVNAAVARCCEDGPVRSTTLMAPGAAFEDAVRVARQNGRLGVGVHLVLTGMKPLSPPSDMAGMLDDTGHMPPSPFALLLLLLSGKVRRESLRIELERQVARVLDWGLVPTHLDTHKHAHILPQVLEVLVEVAAQFSIKWIRMPFERTSFRQTCRAVDKQDRMVFLKQFFESRLTVPLERFFFETVRRAGLRTPDHFFGISLTGIWNERLAQELIEGLPRGVSEWMVHPGICDPELLSSKTRLREQREKEKDLLCSPLLRELIEKRGISLRSFGG
jgi:predicted glycoside hydrolase/deacetylase ChbG (UPF0249 family)